METQVGCWGSVNRWQKIPTWPTGLWWFVLFINTSRSPLLPPPFIQPPWHSSSPLLPFQSSKFQSSMPWRRVMHRWRRGGFEEVRVQGGGDHLPWGPKKKKKKAPASFVNGTIGTVSWATVKSCQRGQWGKTKEVQRKGERSDGSTKQPCHSPLRKCLCLTVGNIHLHTHI